MKQATEIRMVGSDPRCRWPIGATLLAVGLVSVTLIACRNTVAPGNARVGNENAKTISSDLDAAEMIRRNRALDDSQDSIIKLQAKITGVEGSRPVQLTMYRKHKPDGRIVILIEFTSPPEERDRDGLVTAFPDGRIEGLRYVQSTDSFIVINEATSEDALFGLTLQELADGQPEKYDFTLVGEENHEGTPVYRLEGKLKQGGDSRFFRVILLISKEDFTLRQGEFYDNRDELVRRLNVNEVRKVNGHSTRMSWTVDNRSRQKKIDFEAVDVKYDQNLGDSIFTREHLKKIASR